jgi:FkbM family methyltransferase
VTNRSAPFHPILAVVSTALVLSALPACSPSDQARPDIASFLGSEEKLYSQYDEELMIRHFFADRRGGFFLDVGSYDWKDGSTTLYLEKHLGWSGIAIDAVKQHAKGFANNRPATTFLNYIVTDHSGGVETLYLAGPISSTKQEHIRSFPDMESYQPQGIRVPTITLNDLLDKHGVKKVDFVSMDIELGEPAALAGFDIERFRPDLLCVEAGVPVRERLTAYFNEHGYERIDEYMKHDKVNWYFRRRDGSGR